MSQSFRNQPWATRVATGGMGDEAEHQFEQWATENKRGFARYGLNRPPIHVHRLPHMIRYTPDYLMTPYLVEVQGFGRDQKFKLKSEKLAALRQWRQVYPVQMFAWDSTNSRRFMVSLDKLVWLADYGSLDHGTFPEGKPYWEYSANLLAEVGEIL